MILKSLIYLYIISSLSSCSIFKSKEHRLDDFKLNSNDEVFIDQLKSFAKVYIQATSTKRLKLNKKSTLYLRSLYKKIVLNNELILNINMAPSFYVIKSSVPYHFSLPGAHFFFSTSLLKLYVKNENLLMAILSFQVVKSLKNIYKKRTYIPSGSLSTGKLLSIVRIPLEVKNEINQWAYICMGRAGYDSSAYLMWLQIQNKHSLDFSVQYGNIQSISREELVFKNFVAKRNSLMSFSNIIKNSSNDYYRFIKDIKRGRI